MTSLEEFGEFIELLTEPDVCVARWATSSRYHRAGDTCGDTAPYRVGDTPVCPHHYERALNWFYMRIELAPERLEQGRRAATERGRLLAEARSIVYYLRSESTGLIKIGFSANYPGRIKDLRGEHGPLRLLLATAGGRQEEGQAHKEFAAHHVHGEWFRPDKPLLLRILRVREAARYHSETRLPEQVPLREVRALIREIQAAERAARAAVA